MTTKNRWRRKKRLGKFLVAAVVLLAALVTWRFIRHAGQQTIPPNAYYEVKRGDLLISVIEEGALKAVNEVVIRNSLAGEARIIQLAPEGSHVKKGDLLVELDSSQLKDRLNEQEVAYQDNLFLFLQAQENLKIQRSLIESRIKDAELQVELAGTDLEKYRDGDAPKQVKAGEDQIRIIDEAVRIANERYIRTQELHKNGNATKSDLEVDSLSLRREQLALEQSKEDLRLLKKFDQPNMIRMMESKLQQSKDELERLKHRSAAEIAQAEADLKSSEKALEVMDDSLKLQKKQLENARILAPQDGLVVYASTSPFGGRGGGRGDENRRLRDSAYGFMFESDGRFRRGGDRGGGGERRSRSRDSGSGSSYSSSGSSGASSAASQSSAFGSGGGGSSSSSSRQGSSSVSGGEGSPVVSFTSVRQNTGLSSSLGQSSALSSGSSSSTFGSSGQSSYYSSDGSQSGYRSGRGYSSFDEDSFSSGSMVIGEGILVRQRQELIKLPDVSRMLAEVKVEEGRVRQVQPGMQAFVRIESLPGRRFKGTVRKVAILPDAQSSWMNPNNKVYATEVLIEDELPELKPGVSARAEIIITNLPNVLSVPIQAVTRYKGEHVCFVRRGVATVPVPVTTGWFNDRFIEVKTGLKARDLVLLAAGGEQEHIDTENAEGQTNAVESAETNSVQQRTDASPETDSRGIAPNPERTGLSPASSASEVQSSNGRGSPDGAGGRRGRRQDDPEAQRQREEFMKLTPEEREARMREFRGRRGQGPGQQSPNPGAQTPPVNPKP